MKTKMITTALTLSLTAGVAYADVPASQAARLGADLTPTGAEKAGSRSGVAAWTAAALMDQAFVWWDGGALPNPMSDKALYTVTASNAVAI